MKPCWPNSQTEVSIWGSDLIWNKYSVCNPCFLFFFFFNLISLLYITYYRDYYTYRFPSVEMTLQWSLPSNTLPLAGLWWGYVPSLPLAPNILPGRPWTGHWRAGAEDKKIRVTKGLPTGGRRDIETEGTKFKLKSLQHHSYCFSCSEPEHYRSKSWPCVFKKSVVYFSVVFFVENCDILDRNGIENRDGVGMSQVAVVVSPTTRCGFPPLWAAVMRFWSKVHGEGARSVGNWDDEQLPQRNAANPMETNSPSFSKWRWPLKWKADAFSRERLIFHHWNFFHQRVEWWSSDEASPSHTRMWEVRNVTAGERRGGD